MAERKLRVAPGQAWSIEAVTQTFWWTGIRGSGKTHDASVFVEELLKSKAQVVIIDPMTAWYGLRSSVDGRSEGFPIAIFGGPHGDIPLEQGAGAYMADLAVAERVSMILDVALWSKAARRLFVGAFLDRLLSRNEDALHVVIEEAPLFAPQKPPPGGETLLGTVEELVRLGRGHGIGTSLISQRSASLNKEVTSLTEVLVAHRVRSPQDVDAIKKWFELHDKTLATEATARLPHLPTGTAIVSSTDFLDFFGEVTFRPRETFDSSFTPRAGQVRREARTFAALDLASIKEQMAETIERAKAEDPKELQNQVFQLRRERDELKEGYAALEASVARWEESYNNLRGDYDTLDARLAEVEARPARVEKVEVPRWPDNARARLGAVVAALHDVGNEIAEVLKAEHQPDDERMLNPVLPVDPPPEQFIRRSPTPPPTPTPRRRPPARPTGDHDLPDVKLPPAWRALLETLAFYGELDQRRLAVLSGVAKKKSTFRDGLSRLRSLGLAEGSNPIRITDKGLAASEANNEDAMPPPAGQQLVDWWKVKAKLSPAWKRLLQTIVDAYPGEIDYDTLAQRADVDRGVSTFRDGLSRLRTLGLVVGSNPIRATDELMRG